MEKKVILDWYTDYNPNKDKEEPITCRFKVEYSQEDNEVRNAVKECIKWMGSVLGPCIFTMKDTESNFKLEITGRGKDYRCIFCRQFRTRLRNILKEKEINLQQPKRCTFDKEEEYGIDIIEALKRKISLYEEGLDEESSEEDYERWKSAVERIKKGES